MTNKELLHADLLDILFERRNKAYGAYAIRKYYNRRLWKAIGISFSLLAIFILLTSLRGKEKEMVATPFCDESVIVRTIEIEKSKPMEEPRPEPRPQPQVKERMYSPPEIVPDHLASNPLVDMSDLVDAVIGNRNIDGPKLTGDLMPPSSANGTGGEAPPKQPEKKPAVTGPTYLPSFPGGKEALMNFLRKHLRTPDDLDAGQQVTVLIKFLVDLDGSISDYEIVKSGGRGLDNEVIRVVKKMPQWNPGKQNGNAISMYFTQPVTFVGLEE